MKFTVEVDDFYLDGEELSVALRDHIKYAVVAKINENIKDKVDKTVREVVEQEVLAKLTPRIEILVGEILATDKFAQPHGREPLSLKEWVHQKFSDASSHYTTLHTQVRQAATKHVDELKKRYDMVFASQIVNRMKENNLLNGDAAKMLLEPKEGE